MTGRLSAILLCALAALAWPTLAQSSVCQAVYADSIRNVDVQSRIITEQSDVFNRHCEVNGSMKSSSTSLDLTIPVKAIKVGFNGSHAEAVETMQQFCKTHVERQNRFDAFYQSNNHVVVDALKSLNECVRLEKNGVQISHVSTDVRSLVVRVSFNPAEQRVTLNSVQYDPLVATCRSNINGDGAPISVNSSSGQITAAAPFSVACERVAQVTASGVRKFARLELLVDTNQGAYSLAMPTEEMLGFDLATANKQSLLAATQEQIRLNSELQALRVKMAGVKATVHSVAQGEGATVPCSQNGGNVQIHAKNVCGARMVHSLASISSRGGGRCGYTTYQWACVSFP